MSEGQNGSTALENWSAIRAKIREQYPQVTAEELEDVGGDSRRLVAILHQKTGGNISEIEERIDEIAISSGGLLSRVRATLSSATGEVGESIESCMSTTGQMVGDAYDRVVGYGQHGYEATRDRITGGYAGTCEAIERRPMEAVAMAFGAGALLGFSLVSSLLKQPPSQPTWRDRVHNWW